MESSNPPEKAAEPNAENGVYLEALKPFLQAHTAIAGSGLIFPTQTIY